jgi:hypothetical protein
MTYALIATGLSVRGLKNARELFKKREWEQVKVGKLKSGAPLRRAQRRKPRLQLRKIERKMARAYTSGKKIEGCKWLDVQGKEVQDEESKSNHHDIEAIAKLLRVSLLMFCRF